MSEPTEVEVIVEDTPCACSSSFCLAHSPEERCGKPVTVRLKSSFALGESRFSEEREPGICEECWRAITEQFPWLRGIG
jgi:hypothetical protein